VRSSGNANSVGPVRDCGVAVLKPDRQCEAVAGGWAAAPIATPSLLTAETRVCVPNKPDLLLRLTRQRLERPV
jgi:hypothetical protein